MLVCLIAMFKNFGVFAWEVCVVEHVCQQDYVIF